MNNIVPFFVLCIYQNGFLDEQNKLLKNPRNSPWRDMVRQKLPEYAKVDPLDMDISALSEVYTILLNQTVQMHLVIMLLHYTYTYICSPNGSNFFASLYT